MQNPLYGWVGGRKKRQLKESCPACHSSQQTCPRVNVHSGRCKPALPPVYLSCFLVYEHYKHVYKLTCLYRVEYTKPYVIYLIENLYGLSKAILTCIVFNLFTILTLEMN